MNVVLFLLDWGILGGYFIRFAGEIATGIAGMTSFVNCVTHVVIGKVP
jgi:hypothetical protein